MEARNIQHAHAQLLSIGLDICVCENERKIIETLHLIYECGGLRSVLDLCVECLNCR